MMNSSSDLADPFSADFFVNSINDAGFHESIYTSIYICSNKIINTQYLILTHN